MTDKKAAGSTTNIGNTNSDEIIDEDIENLSIIIEKKLNRLDEIYKKYMNDYYCRYLDNR